MHSIVAERTVGSPEVKVERVKSITPVTKRKLRFGLLSLMILATMQSQNVLIQLQYTRFSNSMYTLACIHVGDKVKK